MHLWFKKGTHAVHLSQI